MPSLSAIYTQSQINALQIGGGYSRLLPYLSKRKKGNRCYNIDEFRGEDGGPQKEKKIRRVTNIKTKVGNYSKEVDDESFDIVYSISVVEHIPEKSLGDFFLDCHRILKKTGLMIHYLHPIPMIPWPDGIKLYRACEIKERKPKIALC